MESTLCNLFWHSYWWNWYAIVHRKKTFAFLFDRHCVWFERYSVTTQFLVAIHSPWVSFIDVYLFAFPHSHSSIFLTHICLLLFFIMPVGSLARVYISNIFVSQSKKWCSHFFLQYVRCIAAMVFNVHEIQLRFFFSLFYDTEAFILPCFAFLSRRLHPISDLIMYFRRRKWKKAHEAQWEWSEFFLAHAHVFYTFFALLTCASSS